MVGRIRWRLALLLIAALPSALSAAATEIPHEDIFFLGEHLPEAVEEARYFTLPWPDRSASQGGWHFLASLGAADIGADFARARGGMALFGVEHPWSARGTLTLFGYLGRFEVYGERGENVLREVAVRGVPLDLPSRALFSSPRGTFRHDGVGVTVAQETAGRRPWTFVAGLLVERLELDGYRFDYELLEGADAGAAGVLDLSGSSLFATPYLGVGLSLPIGARWIAVPRLQVGVPLPPGKFETTLRSSEFDLSTESTGARSGKIGDGFFTLGAGLRDRRTGLEIDLGATIAFPFVQDFSHPGIDRALLLSVSWTAR